MMKQFGGDQCLSLNDIERAQVDLVAMAKERLKNQASYQLREFLDCPSFTVNTTWADVNGTFGRVISFRMFVFYEEA